MGPWQSSWGLEWAWAQDIARWSHPLIAALWRICRSLNVIQSLCIVHQNKCVQLGTGVLECMISLQRFATVVGCSSGSLFMKLEIALSYLPQSAEWITGISKHIDNNMQIQNLCKSPCRRNSQTKNWCHSSVPSPLPVTQSGINSKCNSQNHLCWSFTVSPKCWISLLI